MYISKLFSTLFLLGFLTKMPGTLGSLVGLIIGVLLIENIPIIYFLIIYIFLFFIALLAISKYQKHVGVSDKQEIIIDEFLGQIFVLLFIDINLLNIIMAFVLFRFFDIIKIFPVDYIDKNYSGCFGVMMDDILAALQAVLILQCVKIFIL